MPAWNSNLSALWKHLRRLARKPFAPKRLADDCRTFLTLTFEGSALLAVSGRLPGNDAPEIRPGLPAAELPARLGPDVVPLIEPLGALLRDGTPFTVHVTLPDTGLIRIRGRTSGLRAVLAFGCPGAGERALATQLRRAKTEAGELVRMRRRAESSPVAAFETDPGGRVIWANPAAGLLLGEGPERDRTAARILKAGNRAVALLAPGRMQGRGQVTRIPLPAGGTICHVEDTSAACRAEHALEGLRATLTSTFAHLDAALAIFDRAGRLAVFNPALTELSGLSPAMLAGGPSLRQFLEGLRQCRMIPEPRDYTLWRRRLIARASDPGGAPFREDWPLPSGQILRVTVHPHPDRSVTFIFQDISNEVMLERRYREEVESGQAALARMSEGIAIFSCSGEILLSNGAFERIIGFDGFAGLLSGGLDSLVERGAEISGPDPGWQTFREYALATARAKRWDAVIRFGDGRMLLRASALPDGSTMLAILAGSRSGDSSAAVQLHRAEAAR